MKCSTPECEKDRASGRTKCNKCKRLEELRPKTQCATDKCAKPASKGDTLCYICRNRETAIAAAQVRHESGEKRCSKCCEVKPLSQYNVNNATPDALAYRCRECTAEQKATALPREFADQMLPEEELFGNRKLCGLLRQPMGAAQ